MKMAVGNVTAITKEHYEGAVVSERQWIHVIQKGNRRGAKGNPPVLKECLQDIAETYYDDIYRFCAYQTGSREDAYDLAQETFLRFIRYVESYHDRNLKGYLLTIAMNVCRNYMTEQRKENFRRVPFEESLQQEREMSGGYHKWKGGHGSQREEGMSAGIVEEIVDKDKFSDMCVDMSEKTDVPGALGEKISVRRCTAELSQQECHVIDADIHDRLMGALAALPEMQRETILLHYMYDMKYWEIGRRMGVSVSTVKSRIRQGMDKLQRILKREDF